MTKERVSGKIRLLKYKTYWHPIMSVFRWAFLAYSLVTEFRKTQKVLVKEWNEMDNENIYKIPTLQKSTSDKYGLDDRNELNSFMQMFLVVNGKNK